MEYCYCKICGYRVTYDENNNCYIKSHFKKNHIQEYKDCDINELYEKYTEDRIFIKKENKNKLVWKADKEYLKKSEDENKIRDEIMKIIINVHQYLYNNSNIKDGMEVLDNITNIIIIGLLEYKFKSGEIKINIEKYNKEYPEDYADEKSIYLSEIMRGLNPIDKDTNLLLDIELCGKILRSTEIGRILFKHNDFLTIAKSDILREIYFNKLDNVIKMINDNLGKIVDLYGEIYQYITTNYNKEAKNLGQFFTPRKLIRLINNPKFLGKIPDQIDVCDITCGTGGFLTQIIHDYNIGIISGIEINPRSFKYAFLNLFLEIGTIPNNLFNGDTLEEKYQNFKFDLIEANPPYGMNKIEMKKYKYENKETEKNIFKILDKNDKFKIINKGNIIFLNSIVERLKDGGKCAIVLPYGELFNSYRYGKYREEFMKKNKILRILDVPEKSFIGTGVKTCVMIFKKGEPTEKINFYKTNEKFDKLFHIFKINCLDENFSWDYKNYLKLHNKNEKLIYDKLGDICDFKNGKYKTCDMTNEGKYDFYNCSANNPIGKHNEYCFYNDGKNYIILLASGSNKINGNMENTGIGKIYLTNKKCGCVCDTKMITIKKDMEEKYEINYIYIYLKLNRKKILNIVYGATIGHINNENLKNILIPKIEIETQKNMISIIDVIHNYDREKKIIPIDIITLIIKGYIKKYYNDETKIEWKKMGDICEIETGKNMTKNKMINGIYPVIGGGIKPYGFHNIFTHENILTISKDGSSGTVMRWKEKIFLGNHIYKIISKLYDIEKLYLILKSVEDGIKNLKSGIIPGINLHNLKTFKIPIIKDKKFLDDTNQLYNQYEEIHNSQLKFYKTIITQFKQLYF